MMAERIITASFGHRLVELCDGDGQLHHCRLGAGVGAAVAGDVVVGLSGEMVTELRKRHSLLMRFSAGGRPRPAVANVEQLVLVLAPMPTPLPRLIDHCLATAELSGLTAQIVINKCELSAMADVEQLLTRYRRCGYPLLRCSARCGDGLAELQRLLANRYSVLIGQSGVGKSTLLNYLTGAQSNTKPLSAKNRRGVHTTAVTQGHPLPDGGWLFDMPGIQDCSLAHVEARQLAQAFAEFRPFIDQCRFHNCRHDQEPGCAVVAASGRGEISPERLESYRQSLRTPSLIADLEA